MLLLYLLLTMSYRFGIDATAIPVKPTGIGNYTLQLIWWLSEQLKGEEDELYVFGRSDQRCIPEFNNTLFIDCGKVNILKRLFWEQTVFPSIIKKYNLNLMHSPNYSIPIFAECKKVCTIHDLTCYLFPKRRKFFHGLYFRKMIKCSVEKADFIITVSDNTKKDIEKIFCRKFGNMQTIYQGYNSIFSEINYNKNLILNDSIDLSRPYFLFVSTIEPSKNVERLISAFSRFISDTSSEYMLYLVGKIGWYYKKIKNILNKPEFSRNIRYLGYQNNIQLSLLYKHAFCFVFPSLYEGFGIPLLEAMACGIPVICSNTSSIPEVVDNAALTFDPFDKENILLALKTISKDKNLRQELIKKGYDQVKKFSWEKSSRDILNIYYKLVDK